MKKKILVTGSDGFIGSHLCPALDKYDVMTWDLNSKPRGDIFDDNLKEAIGEVDVVIHLAALTNVNQSFEDRSAVFYVNVLGTARVAQLCSKYNKKLIYPSSAAIFHPELSPYAHSKAVAEEVVSGIMEESPTVILRLYNVYGENMNKNSGSIMYNFLTSEDITIYGDGEQTRDYVNVKDVVGIMKAAIEDEAWDGNIIDVGSGQSYSTNTIAGWFAYYRGKRKIIYEPTRRETKWSTANIAMLKALYKKPLLTDVQKDIESLCLYYEKN